MKIFVYWIGILLIVYDVAADSSVPFLTLETLNESNFSVGDTSELKYLPLAKLVDKDKDTSEFWREKEIISLIQENEKNIDYEKCEQSESDVETIVKFPSLRVVRPICRSRLDYQSCPQCPHYSNFTECELFRDSCRERKVDPSEYRVYCDKKYGKWRTMFIPADYSQCRCCDECVYYRELDQSCMQDDYTFENTEDLPITTIDFRAGCNPYWGHPDQEKISLRCDKTTRRCVPVSLPTLPNESLKIRKPVYRYEAPPEGLDCPISCRGYKCHAETVQESQCTKGAFVPHPNQCNCCGGCSLYQQLNEKCAEFKKTLHFNNGTKEVEVEEEFLEPGCDDGLVCRHGICQDIHTVESSVNSRRAEDLVVPNEPCKEEMKYFKKKFGPEGHLHYEAPQCTPLWLYSAVQCRRFVCYCALEDGSIIEGVKVPRVEVSNMNCDCARERCRTGLDVECDGYGNYKGANFDHHSKKLRSKTDEDEDGKSVGNAEPAGSIPSQPTPFDNTSANYRPSEQAAHYSIYPPAPQQFTTIKQIR